MAQLAKAPLAAFTIVVTVALGLGLVAVVFTVLNTLVFRVDQVPDIGQMYTVERTQLATGEGAPLTRPMFDAMRTDTHVFTDAYATVPDIDLDVDGRRVAVTLVTGNFFQVVRVSPIIGRALMPADDAAAGGNAVVVLSHKGWERHHPAAAGSHRGLRAALPRLRIDPVAYLASLGLIVAACLLAAWLPAARAAKVDPMHTLRLA